MFPIHQGPILGGCSTTEAHVIDCRISSSALRSTRLIPWWPSHTGGPL